MGAADDADEEGGLVFVEITGGNAEVGAGGFFEAVGTGAEVDAVEVVGEDLVLRVAGLDAVGEGDFEELAVDGFLAEFIGVARELHGEGGGSLGELAIEEVAEGGTGKAAYVDAAVVAEVGIFTGVEGLLEEVGDVFVRDEASVFAVDGVDLRPVAIQEDGAGGHGGDFFQIVVGRGEKVIADDDEGDDGEDEESPQRPSPESTQSGTEAEFAVLDFYVIPGHGLKEGEFPAGVGFFRWLDGEGGVIFAMVSHRVESHPCEVEGFAVVGIFAVHI